MNTTEQELRKQIWVQCKSSDVCLCGSTVFPEEYDGRVCQSIINKAKKELEKLKKQEWICYRQSNRDSNISYKEYLLYEV
jgi:hypothetical protein